MALDALLVNCKVPRIKEENYSEIMGTLGRCMKDANIVVVTIAAQCVEGIARGLRKPFGQYRHLIMMPMVEKLKERKPSVVEALSNAMDGVFLAVSPTPQITTRVVLIYISRLDYLMFWKKSKKD